MTYIIVIKDRNMYKEIFSSASFDENLNKCEELSKDFDIIYRAKRLDASKVLLEHKYKGSASYAMNKQVLCPQKESL